MNEDYKEDLVREYLEGKLEGKELEEFRLELAQNPQLKEEVEGLRKVELGLHGLGVEGFKKEVKNWEEEYQSGKKDEGKIRIFKPYYSVAAVVILLLAASILFVVNRSPDYQALYAENFYPYEDMILDRATLDDENISLKQGMEAYNNHEYREAIQFLEAHLMRFSDNSGVALYLGISHMELDHIAEAESYFGEAEKDPLFMQQASWYRALLYLKDGQNEQARNSLEKIANNEEHYQQANARELLDDLD